MRALLLILPLSIVLAAASACAPATASGPVKLDGESGTLRVTGEYRAVTISQVDAFSIDGSALVLKGPAESVRVDLPEGAGPPKTSERWALTTEAQAGRRRTLTFTNEQSLDDFTITLPEDATELRYGTLDANATDDVLVFAWGKASRSFWGFVRIAPKAK